MRARAALLADSAGFDQRGLLNVQGGGWEFFTLPRLPWTVQGAFAGLLELDPSELGSTVALRFTIGHDGQEPSAFASLAVTAGGLLMPFAIPFLIAITSADTIVARLLGPDGGEVASADCPIRLPPDEAPVG